MTLQEAIAVVLILKQNEMQAAFHKKELAEAWAVVHQAATVALMPKTPINE